MNMEEMFEQEYSATQDYGRTQFIRKIVNLQCEIESLKEELKWWKQHCDDIEMENGCDEDY